VDIFHRTERLLPEFKLHGGIELRKACVEIMLKRIGILEIDGMRLVRVLCNVGKVETQSLAKTPKFDLALVFETKLKGLLRDLLTIGGPSQTMKGKDEEQEGYMIYALQASIVLQGF
jgi:hypothetical protein